MEEKEFEGKREETKDENSKAVSNEEIINKEKEAKDEAEAVTENESRISTEELKLFQSKTKALKEEVAKMLVGQEEMMDLLIVALFTGGHVLLEGVPGIAKTMAAKLLAKTVSTQFSRIQFTPDLMPADVIGTTIFNMASSSFEFQEGPVFSNLVLIDEINRAPAKTQAALIEVMEEKQITVDGETHKMERPFFIIATQNPIEQEGTYQLPEAQLDRFVFRIKLKYPSLNDEKRILSRYEDDFKQDMKDINPILDPKDIETIYSMIERIFIKEEVLNYIAEIVTSTRTSHHIYLGASPRASLWLLRVSKAYAALNGRYFVTPDDIRFLAPYVLNHRIILSHEKELEGAEPEQVIAELIETIDVPR
jgi:MoxR-like ATPase